MSTGRFFGRVDFKVAQARVAQRATQAWEGERAREASPEPCPMPGDLLPPCFVGASTSRVESTLSRFRKEVYQGQ